MMKNLTQRRKDAARQSGNQSPGAGDDACQRMKSANGFFGGEMTSRPAGLEPFIRWRKGSAIPTAEIYCQKNAILRYSTAEAQDEFFFWGLCSFASLR
jgi:hypothetical protein